LTTFVQEPARAARLESLQGGTIGGTGRLTSAHPNSTDFTLCWRRGNTLLTLPWHSYTTYLEKARNMPMSSRVVHSLDECGWKLVLVSCQDTIIAIYSIKKNAGAYIMFSK